MATRQEIRESEQSMSSVLLEVIGPALIMLMVGSLVFFLIEIFYRGPHTARLCWVFGLFTFASVLVSRVSIESGKQRGMLFGFALGLAAFMTSFTLVEFEGALGSVLEPLLLIIFICVVMWSASKLTWDCTVIDQSRDSSASGITELVRRKFQGRDDVQPKTDSDANRPELQNESSDAQAGNLIRAFFKSRSERKNTPGIWVFYFSMAAIPLFGIGQWFVSPGNNGGYAWSVLLFGVYLAAGLALMMTTSLLGLQRYLRKRNTHMPPEIARTWLAIGAVISVLVLGVVLIFPRPNASAALEQSLNWFSSPDRRASDWAMGEDGTEEKESAKGTKSSEDGKKSSSDAKTEKTGGNSKGAKKTEDGGKDGKGKGSKSDPNSQNNDNDSKNQNGKNRSDQDQQQGGSRPEEKGKAAGKQGNKNRNGGRKSKSGKQRSQTSNFRHSLQGVSNFSKLIVYGLAFIAIIALLILFRKELVALFQSLFRKKEKQPEEKTSAPVGASAPIPRPPPFAQFRNPFPWKGKTPPEKVVEYSFRALEAWGFEQGVLRSQDQTPHEFAAELETLNAKLGRSALDLSNLFCKNLFGDRKIRPEELEPLKELWHLMQNTAIKSSTEIVYAN